MWEGIHGFNSPDEYNNFIKYIEKQIDIKTAQEIEINQDYGKGEIYGGRWFKNLKTDAIWRLIPPDIPFKGLWEQVDTSMF